MTPERKKGVRGSIIDHALLTLAFVDAYEVYETPSYLKSAKRIADYSLDHLYDWYGGGFFERNSPDRHLYALGDHIDLTKPVSENGVFSYALTKLSSLDDNPEYTIAAQDTIARLAQQPQQ